MTIKLYTLQQNNYKAVVKNVIFLAEKHEGSIYIDSVHVPTIGYGFNLTKTNVVGSIAGNWL